MTATLFFSLRRIFITNFRWNWFSNEDWISGFVYIPKPTLQILSQNTLIKQMRCIWWLFHIVRFHGSIAGFRCVFLFAPKILAESSCYNLICSVLPKRKFYSTLETFQLHHEYEIWRNIWMLHISFVLQTFDATKYWISAWKSIPYLFDMNGRFLHYSFYRSAQCVPKFSQTMNRFNFAYWK